MDFKGPKGASSTNDQWVEARDYT